MWTPNNSFAYSVDVDSGDDGIINIVMQQQIGGDPPPGGTDNNPILQGIIVHILKPDIKLSNGSFLSNVPAGTTVGTLTTLPNPAVSFTYSLVAGDGDDDNAGFEIDGDELKTSAARTSTPSSSGGGSSEPPLKGISRASARRSSGSSSGSSATRRSD